MNKAIKLVLKEGTILDLYFFDCTVKRYDVLSLANKFPQLNALKDRNLFLKGRLFGWSGVIWNDDLDLSADGLYEKGVPCEPIDSIEDYRKRFLEELNLILSL